MKVKMYKENTNHKKGVISHQLDFRQKKITKNGKLHYITIRVSVQQEVIKECLLSSNKDVAIDSITINLVALDFISLYASLSLNVPISEIVRRCV